MRPCGQDAWRPSRQRSPIQGSMMVTGSTRGKCSAPQAGQMRFQPPSATSDSWPQTEQKRWRRRQSNRLLAQPAIAASSPGSSAASVRSSSKRPSRSSAPSVGSAEPSSSTAKTGVAPFRPRNASRSSRPPTAWRASGASRKARRRSPACSRTSGRPCQRAIASACGSARRAASHWASRRRSPARSSGLPAKVLVKESRVMGERPSKAFRGSVDPFVRLRAKPRRRRRSRSEIS